MGEGAAVRLADVLLVAGAASVAPACNSVFQCADASSCSLDGVSGFCEADGFCSFPDPECPSGHRYGEFAPDDLASDCVPTSGTTGTTSTATGDTTLSLESGAVETSATSSDSSSTGDVVEPPGCPAPPTCTLFVAPVADADADGSEDNPFGTIQPAVDVALPGDVICVREGDYEAHVVFATSGSEGAPIVLRSHPGETARLTGGMKIMTGWGVSLGWIVIEELDITQNGGTNPDVGDQCIYFHSAHDVVIRHNYIHDCNGGGLVGNARDLLVDGNRISRCALDAVGTAYGGAIGMGGTRIVVQNNRIERNASYGVILSAEPWDPKNDANHPEDASYSEAADWIVSNNVFAFNQNGAAIRLNNAGATGGTFQNNIVFENNESAGPNGIEFNGGGGHLVRNNMFFGTAAAITDIGSSYIETDSIYEDPQFIDPDGTDFRVQENSPAIDAGIADAAPDHDTECAVRPQGDAVDLGVYERAP